MERLSISLFEFPMIFYSDDFYIDPSDGSTILINDSWISLLIDCLEAIFSSDSSTMDFSSVASVSIGFSEV
jgi:hypothetical protein